MSTVKVRIWQIFVFYNANWNPDLKNVTDSYTVKTRMSVPKIEPPFFVVRLERFLNYRHL